MNVLKSSFRPGLLAVAGVAAVLAMPWSVAQAQPTAASDCSAQLSRVQSAALGGRNLQAGQLQRLEACVRDQLATADSLAASQVDSTMVQSAEAPTVVASFSTIFLSSTLTADACVRFNSDGTISGGSGTTTITSGSYLGTPGVLVVYSYTLGGIGVSGVAIGPFFAGFSTFVRAPYFGLWLGLQVPSC